MNRKINIFLIFTCFLIIIIIYIFFPKKYYLDAIIVSLLIIYIMMLLFPEICLNLHDLFSPKNLTLSLMLMKIIFVPFTVALFGNYIEVLPKEPSSNSMNLAIVFETLAFLSFSVGIMMFSHVYKEKKAKNQVLKEKWKPNYKTILWFYFIGLIGLMLRFDGITGYILYLKEPGLANKIFFDHPTVGHFLGQLLRPFLTYGIVFGWCIWLDKQKGKNNLFLVIRKTLFFMIFVFIVSFDLNRATMLVPILAMIGVLTIKENKISLPIIFLFVIILLLATIYLGEFRNAALFGKAKLSISVGDAFLSLIQNYFGGPQFFGYFLESIEFGNKTFLGKTIIASIMHPIPILGKTFREYSGPSIYNVLIYGTGAPAADQIIPTIAEIYLNFNIIGIILIYLILGILISYIEKVYLYNKKISSIYVYILIVLGYWLAQMATNANFAIASQIAFYGLWPIYLLFILRNKKNHRANY